MPVKSKEKRRAYLKNEKEFQYYLNKNWNVAILKTELLPLPKPVKVFESILSIDEVRGCNVEYLKELELIVDFTNSN